MRAKKFLELDIAAYLFLSSPSFARCLLKGQHKKGEREKEAASIFLIFCSQQDSDDDYKEAGCLPT